MELDGKCLYFEKIIEVINPAGSPVIKHVISACVSGFTSYEAVDKIETFFSDKPSHYSTKALPRAWMR